MVRFAKLTGLAALGVLCCVQSAPGQYRGLDAQRCAVIDCNAPSGNSQSAASTAAAQAAAAAAAEAAAAQQRRDQEAAAEAARQRQNEADSDDQKGLTALNSGDWDTAASWFISGLELEPDDEAIRGHLDAARIRAADSASAAQTNAVRQRIDDAIAAADIETLRTRLHIEALQLAVPAACLIAKEIGSGLACEVLNEAKLGWNMAGADGDRAMFHIFGEFARRKIVFLSFGTALPIGARVSLVQAMYNAQARQFARLVAQINKAMLDSEKAARLRTAFAIADSVGVQALQVRALAESGRRAAMLQRYIIRHPDGPGVTVRCEAACQQLIDAAQRVDAFY